MRCSDGVTSTWFPAIGTTAVVMVADQVGIDAAEALLRADLRELDVTCSRFRDDSEIRMLERWAGTEVQVGPLLARIIDAALRAAVLTDGLVDPTVGRSMEAIGYDRDFAEVAPSGPAVLPEPAPGWWQICWDPVTRELVMPEGTVLDVSATAAAFAADRAARRIAAMLGCGALVALGGDIAVAGRPPDGGWRVGVGDDHADTHPVGGHVVTIEGGGLATSGTARRRWERGGQLVHHIVDPRTGAAACGWRTVSVAAGSCVDANVASTAAMVLGSAAPAWLAARGLPARLVADDGSVHVVGGWPGDPGTV